MAPLLGRSEINLIRLIAQCEEMVASKNEIYQWRIEKYIEKLEELYQTTCNSDRKPDSDRLKEYQKKIAFIKDFMVTKNLPSLADKALANQRLAPSSKVTLPNVVTTPTGKQIQQAAAVQYNKQMKNELFAKEDSTSGNVLKHRSTTGTSTNANDMLKYQEEQHEKIAEEIINLTRNLKHNISVAGKIIKDDTAVLKEASKKTDDNVSRLKHESTRLEGHLQKGTNWWLWIAIALVCATFLFMIFFIRFFPKPR